MSKTEKEKQAAGQNPEKIVTRYDRKVQRRKEEKEKAQRERFITRVVGIVFLAALVCIVASFPIRTWMSLNGTYIEVNGEKVTRVEFDYNYNVVTSSFINQYYTTYLYYFGVDLSGDLSTQMYSADLSWKDYFEEMTVEHIAQNKAMMKEAREAGYVHDVSDEYSEYTATLKDAAAEANSSVKDYIRQLYGAYATESRVRPYVEETMYLSAYNEEVVKERLTPSQEEIREYYEDNSASYDSVDYYVLTVDAQLPTEPTELADPVEEPQEGEDAAGDEAEDAPYQPSEAEIAAAMEIAKAEAEAAESKLRKEGELNTNVRRSSVTYLLQSWLFDGERKEGDTTVIEDSTGHRYYAVEFKDRYLDPVLTANARLVMTAEGNGQDILDEWKGGAATEESFGEICDKYKDPASGSEEGGLYENLTPSGVPSALAEWLFDEGRKAGDASVISQEGSEYAYVVYYVGSGDEDWIVNIRSQLLQQAMQEYLSGLAQDAEVRDPGNNLKYLEVREAEAAAASAQQEQQDNGAEEDNTGSDQ